MANILHPLAHQSIIAKLYVQCIWSMSVILRKMYIFLIIYILYNQIIYIIYIHLIYSPYVSMGRRLSLLILSKNIYVLFAFLWLHPSPVSRIWGLLCLCTRTKKYVPSAAFYIRTPTMQNSSEANVNAHLPISSHLLPLLNPYNRTACLNFGSHSTMPCYENN